MTTGRIGTLSAYGRQVGGFLDWRIDTLIKKTKSLPETRTVAVAASFWMLEEVNTEYYDAAFYFLDSGKLILAQEAKVLVGFPGTFLLDKWIKASLDMELIDGY